MEFVIGGIALVIGVVIGIGIGIFLGTDRMRTAIESQSVGNLRIDRSESDMPPQPYLEVGTGYTIEGISKMRFVILKVIDEDYLSHD